MTRAWAAFITGTSWRAIPDPVRHAAKRSMLNLIGTALGAAGQPAVQTAVEVLQPFAGAPQASLIGRRERLDILSAATVNAIGGNLFEFDDTHLRTVIHPTAPVAPVALALAELRGLTGAQVLEAFVLGVEVACRLGNAVSPQHYARGWHITATCGVFGAAAAAAKLLGLDAGRSAHALGIAASASGGIIENLTTAGKNLGVGNAARNGLLSALMAERGYTAAALAVEGRFGWARVTGDGFDRAAMTAGLGEEWELLGNAFKPYPSGVVLHAVVDACLELRDRHELDAADIEHVLVGGHPLLLERGVRRVVDERDAKVSLHHSAAIALLFGAAGLPEHSEPIVSRPDVVALRERVAAQVDDLPIGAARVTVTTRDGVALSTVVEHARGSLARPMSDAELETKVRTLAAHGNAHVDVGRIIELVWHLDEAAGIGDLMRGLQP